MIKVKEENVEIKGNLIDIKTDLSWLIRRLRKELSKSMGQEKADEYIREAIRYGFMEDEEIENELVEIKKKLPAKIVKAVELMYFPFLAGGDSDEN